MCGLQLASLRRRTGRSPFEEERGRPGATKRRFGSPTVVALLLLSGACDDGGLAPADALALAAPHTEDFESFDRWARRAVEADPAFRSRASLEETVFAPIRREDGVYAVWIEREGSDDRPLSFGHYDRPPKEVTWTRVRHDGLGELSIADFKLKDPRRRMDDSTHGEPCLFIRRARRTGPHLVLVTIAYRRAED